MNLFFLIFLVSVVLSLFLLNLVVYIPIVRSYKLTKSDKTILKLLLLLMTFVIVAGQTSLRLWGVYWLSTIGNYWLGILAIGFTVMLINLILILLKPSISRKTTRISIIAIIIFSIWAVYNGHKLPTVQEIDLYSSKIAQSDDGLRVLLVSEFHLMNNASEKRLARDIELINSLYPDVVLIGGDLIDEPYPQISHLIPYLQKISAPLGVYSVPGNHDYYNNLDSYLRFTKESGFINLLNKSINLTESVVLIGITDHTAKRSGSETPDLQKAFSGVDNQRYTIFLAHQPLFIEEALGYGGDLLLAGHTHRGQIPPMTFLVELHYDYPYGLYQVGESNVYTTSGIFTWGPQMRLFSRNEIVVFNLKSDFQK